MTNVTLQNTSNQVSDADLAALTKSQNAVVLLSGGLDSVTCLYWAKARYASVTAVSFNYGQRHNSELVAAKTIAETVAAAIKPRGETHAETEDIRPTASGLPPQCCGATAHAWNAVKQITQRATVQSTLRFMRDTKRLARSRS